MIKPSELPAAAFGELSPSEAAVEALFDAAISEAAEERSWPAIVPTPNRSAIARAALTAVAHRYRLAGWQVTLDCPNTSVLATIKRV